MGDFFAGPHGTALGLTRLDPETGEYTTTAPFTMIEYKRLWETRRGKWFALAVITGVALSTSVRIFQAFGCKADEMRTNNLCIDSKVAISMTTLGGILSLAMIGIGSLGGGSIENIEKIGAVTTTGVWSICLGFITFGEGPVCDSAQTNLLSHLIVYASDLIFLCQTFDPGSLQSIGYCSGKSFLFDMGWIHSQRHDPGRLLSWFRRISSAGCSHQRDRVARRQ